MKRVNFSMLILVVSGIFAGFLLGMFVGRRAGGQILYVAPTETMLPSYQQTEAAEQTQPESTEATAPVNINTADAETLMTIPGVGQTLAERIISYREEWGDFIAPEELMEVDGIGEKKFEQIRAYVIVR